MNETATPWIEGKTIGQVLRETARRFPDRDALVFPQRNFRASYAELDRQVDSAARGLVALGLKKGDHFALWATNHPEWAILQFATARIGAVLVTVNPAYRSHELDYVLRQSDAKMLALIDRFKTSDYFAMLDEVCPELSKSSPGQLRAEKFPQLRTVLSLSQAKRPGMIDYPELLDRGRSVSPQELSDRESLLFPTEAINIQYTSGTTGFPKGATLHHRSLLYNAYYAAQCQRLSEHDRMCIPVPLYHCFGCVLGTLCAIASGAAMIFPYEYFEPEKSLAAIEAERCTVLYGVPTMFIAQLEHPTYPSRNLRSLRTGIMAGAPCPIELMKKVTGEMGARELTIGYGLTEFSPLITQTRPDDPLELRVGTVGRALPGVEVQIIDPATGQSLPPEQAGELCARGHGTMIGYYKMDEATAKAIDKEGWLHSGDLAVKQPNGYYRITGRLKDMIIRGGENIFPREIEEFLYRHPAVEEVQIVGVPDPKYGEEVLAWIKLRSGSSATEDEIRSFCRASLAHYKVPRYVKFVTSYPMTVTGKIQKFKIREQAIQELGLQQAAKIETA